jgi:protoporphyrinogen oxidase
VHHPLPEILVIEPEKRRPLEHNRRNADPVEETEHRQHAAHEPLIYQNISVIEPPRLECTVPLAGLAFGRHLSFVPPSESSRSVRRLAPGDRIVVCGAGPAGLTAAYLLARRGYQVCVLESDSQVGGLARTVKYKDFRFDIGGHRFFTKIPEVQAFWDEVLGDELIDVPRLSRIHYRGKYFHYPLRAAEAVRGLGPWQATAIVLSYLRARLWPSQIEENFEQWVSNRFGHRLYQIFFKTYTEKVWGVPCTEIRAEWAAQRIQGLSLARAILAATSLQKRSSEVRTLIHEFKYPRLGPGQMWERCADLLSTVGAEVRLNHEITAFELVGDRVVAARATTPTGEQRFEAEHFITTMPLRSLVRAFGAAVPEAVRTAAEGLTYRDFILVALILDQASLFPDNWIYVHTPGIKVGRVQNFNNWSPALVPDPNKTCLGMEYFCFENDGLWERQDQELVALATQELESLGLARGARVIEGSVVRMRKAYPIYDSAYRGYLETIRSYVDAIPNLHTIGRNGMHKYNNQDHSMYTAMLTVANLEGASHDLWAVNNDLDYHEEQRITSHVATAGLLQAKPIGERRSARRPAVV